MDENRLKEKPEYEEKTDWIRLAFGTSWAYKTEDGRYEDVADVYKKGQIVWKKKDVPEEDRIRICQCAASYLNKLNEMKHELEEHRRKLTECLEGSFEYFLMEHDIGVLDEEVRCIEDDVVLA